jgi:hypothetical protein
MDLYLLGHFDRAKLRCDRLETLGFIVLVAVALTWWDDALPVDFVIGKLQDSMGTVAARRSFPVEAVIFKVFS